MKTRYVVSSLAAVLAVTSAAASAASRQSTVVQAPVVGVEPIIEVVTDRIPHETCHDERVRVVERGGQQSTTPAILGAVVGGAIGGAIGNNTGAQGVISGAGALLGASVGRDIERQQRVERVRYVTEEVCDIEYELRERERISGYRVSYQVGDTIYETRTATDPGATLAVRIDLQPLP